MAKRFRAKASVQGGSGIRSVDPGLRAYVQQMKGQMDSIMKEYSNLLNHTQHEIPELLKYALQPAFDKSQEYVPVKTGRLKGSGYLVVRTSARLIEAEIGYGRGHTPPYAAIVHERLDFRHEAPTRAKYLQAALEESFPEVKERVLSGLGDIFGG